MNHKNIALDENKFTECLYDARQLIFSTEGTAFRRESNTCSTTK